MYDQRLRTHHCDRLSTSAEIETLQPIISKRIKRLHNN